MILIDVLSENLLPLHNQLDMIDGCRYTGSSLEEAKARAAGGTQTLRCHLAVHIMMEWSGVQW